MSEAASGQLGSAGESGAPSVQAPRLPNNFIWRMGDPDEDGYVAASDPRRDGQAVVCRPGPRGSAGRAIRGTERRGARLEPGPGGAPAAAGREDDPSPARGAPVRHAEGPDESPPASRPGSWRRSGPR
ncbi:hypothetical protein F6X51_12800 [Methylobacterium planeticum]|uniref:Uncharacterized protein n=1 Tax=Methylobacterium planeticum TaxID=2615211 RepID=A0A6N6MR47_9HYPH|nr:hypothetical protein F6X51_12800 [Methylobacterium planeticum]